MDRLFKKDTYEFRLPKSGMALYERGLRPLMDGTRNRLRKNIVDYF